MTVKERRSAKSVLVGLGAALVSVLVALGVAELAVRAFVPVRSVGPAVTTYDSVYRTRLKRNFKGVQITPEFRMHLTTNSLGFRGPEPASFPRRGVLYFGDSFTVGYGVDDGQEYAAIVSRRLAEAGRPIPYVNDGRGNTGEGHWVKFLQREGARFDPRVVVLQINPTDITDNPRDGLFTLDTAGSLVALPTPGPGAGRMLEPVLDKIPFVSNSYLLGLVRQAYFAIASPAPRPAVRAATPGAATTTTPALTPAQLEAGLVQQRQADRLIAKLLGEVGRLCEQGHWPAVALRVGLDEHRDSLVDSTLSAHGIRSVRIPSRAERPDLYFAVDGHWNVKGQAYAADVVLGLLSALDSATFGVATPAVVATQK